MQIVLICRDEKGSVAFPAGIIEGLPVPARRYDIVNNHLLLDGFDEVILHHDADKLLAMPDGLYRMQTPGEQNATAKATRRAKTVEEAAPVEVDGG